MKLLFENWRKFMKEGKAIKANPSMREWATNAFSAYRKAGKEGGLEFSDPKTLDKPFFTGYIEDPYSGEEVEVKAVIVPTPEERPDKNNKFAIHFDTLGTQNQTMKIHHKTAEPAFSDSSLVIPLMIHELVHVIDPKFKLDKEHPQRQIHKDTIKYHNSPHEQDAFMRQSVENMKKLGLPGDYFPDEPDFGKFTKEKIQDYKPRTPWEKTWYETNPKAWRKLLNTLYAEVEEE